MLSHNQVFLKRLEIIKEVIVNFYIADEIAKDNQIYQKDTVWKIENIFLCYL